MKFTVVTIMPELFETFVSCGVIGRAISDGTLEVEFVNPRDFTEDVHRSVDDTPFGGGAGMVLKPEPMMAAIDAAGAGHRVYLSPAGDVFDQAKALTMSSRDHIVLVCGRYEGLDARVVAQAIDEELSVGDYVVSGGEVPAMLVIEAIARNVDGVLGNQESAAKESHSGGLLEHDHYTRPAEFAGQEVPEVLRSGNHARIEQYRQASAEDKTKRRRPELWRKHLVAKLAANFPKVHVALCHHPVRDRDGQQATTSITNLDMHDLGRLVASYGLEAGWIVTPVDAQREKAAHMIETWSSGEPFSHRDQAIAKLRTAPSLEAVAAKVKRSAMVATTAEPARVPPDKAVDAAGVWELASERPVVLVFGTGWGLTDSVISAADAVLNPILAGAEYNHLSVRTAMAICLDRLWGEIRDYGDPA